MLVARVLRTIEGHRLLSRGDRVLVAVSGGPDSMALLLALGSLAPRLGIDLEAVTIDHGLRPEAAQEHEEVARWIRDRGIEAVVHRLGLEPGAGAQARARDARYDVLRAHAAARGLGAIAVGHTRDDQAETVLARLFRGAGVRGLAGALRRRDDGIVRPLLDCSRAEVLAYLEAREVRPIVVDPANADPRYLRSRIRHGHLPALAAEQPEIAATLAALADEAAELRALVGGLAAPFEGRPLEREALLDLPIAVRREVLRRWSHEAVRARGGAEPGRTHLEALEHLCLTARGEVRLPTGLRVRIENGTLWSEPEDTTHGPGPDEG